MDIYNRLKNNALELQCPDCGTTLGFGLQDLQEKRVLECTCGNEISLEEGGKSTKKLLRAAEELHKAFKALGLQ